MKTERIYKLVIIHLMLCRCTKGFWGSDNQMFFFCNFWVDADGRWVEVWLKLKYVLSNFQLINCTLMVYGEYEFFSLLPKVCFLSNFPTLILQWGVVKWTDSQVAEWSVLMGWGWRTLKFIPPFPKVSFLSNFSALICTVMVLGAPAAFSVLVASTHELILAHNSHLPQEMYNTK